MCDTCNQLQQNKDCPCCSEEPEEDMVKCHRCEEEDYPDNMHERFGEYYCECCYYE